jgi:hypothetical protein
MIGTQITIKNHDTGEEIVLNDHTTDPNNVIALQTFPTFENEVRSQNIPRQGAHGEFHLPSFYSGMSIVLQGVIVGDEESDVWNIKKKFDSIMSLSRTGFGKETSSQKITPALAINECTNPSGKFSTADWDDIDATITNADNAFDVETETDNDSGIEHIVDDTVPKNAGDDYFGACDVENAEASDRTFRIRLQARDSDENVLSTEYADEVVAGGEKMRLAVELADIPANVADIRFSIVRLGDDDAIDGDIFHVSKVLIVKNPPTNIDAETYYFDGDTDDLSRLSFEWNGADGNSASSMYRMTFPSMYKNSVRLSFTNPNGQKVFIDATPTKAVSYNRPLQQRYKLDFQVVLRSNFPVLIVEDDTPEFFTGEFGVLETGFKLPTHVPFVIGEEYISGGMIINASQAGFALVRMYGSDNGSIINPRITNLTNGSTVRIIKPLLGSQRYFLIDGILQQMVDENGISVQQYSDGDFIYLNEGENVLLYSADESIPN